VDPKIPVVFITGHGTADTAIEAMRLGAYEYLLKPLELDHLTDLVDRAFEISRLMRVPATIPAAGAAEGNSDAMIGRCSAMQEVYKAVGRVAPQDVTALILGESGTGKELIARAIYQHSDRVNAPFVAINCAAIPETLLESELFGHERGAFTGAESRRIGRFEQADKGTIFLDEIGDMTPGTQVKLMRVLQEKNLQRLGGKETIPVDVRVIAATHRNLETAIQQNLFREDLFYRISVVVLNLPPLRERKEDIPDLVRFFLHKYASEFSIEDPAIHPNALEFLQLQPWPGNVRELENATRKMLLLAQRYTISVEHVRAALAKINVPAASTEKPLQAYADELLAAAQRGELSDAHARMHELTERILLGRAIELAHGNQAKVSRWLGISRLTLRDKLIQYGLHPKQE
jgi:DNA-binding NtrC family response regulator